MSSKVNIHLTFIIRVLEIILFIFIYLFIFTKRLQYVPIYQKKDRVPV